jgi:hypothetical protein
MKTAIQGTGDAVSRVDEGLQIDITFGIQARELGIAKVAEYSKATRPALSIERLRGF